LGRITSHTHTFRGQNAEMSSFPIPDLKRNHNGYEKRKTKRVMEIDSEWLRNFLPSIFFCSPKSDHRRRDCGRNMILLWRRQERNAIKQRHCHVSRFRSCDIGVLGTTRGTLATASGQFSLLASQWYRSSYHESIRPSFHRFLPQVREDNFQLGPQKILSHIRCSNYKRAPGEEGGVTVSWWRAPLQSY
jgi:hypothetical protein